MPASQLFGVISDFIIDFVDDFLQRFHFYEIVISGDLNRFNVHYICNSLNLRNNHNHPTYGDAELDYILLTDDLADEYCICTGVPFDRSTTPHYSLLATPSMKCKNANVVYRKVYDLRESFIHSFAKTICTEDWKFLDDDHLTLDRKCDLFHEILNRAAGRCIPVSYVRCTQRDKPWITPLIKDLINKRWTAFRSRNFALYNHLKAKVNKEICKSKLLWTKKMQSKDVWKTVHTHVGKKCSNPLMPLLSQYQSIQEAVEDINTKLSSVFLPLHSIEVMMQRKCKVKMCGRQFILMSAKNAQILSCPCCHNINRFKKLLRISIPNFLRFSCLYIP